MRTPPSFSRAGKSDGLLVGFGGVFLQADGFDLGDLGLAVDELHSLVGEDAVTQFVDQAALVVGFR